MDFRRTFIAGNSRLKLSAREVVYRVACRHDQGDKPNILVYCSRRGGSTWLINVIAAHPGMRYVARPFRTIPISRFADRLPDLATAARHQGDHSFRQIVSFDGPQETQFLDLARDVIQGNIEVYPTIAFRAPYFERVTDRIVFQMTSGPPLIEWFDDHLDVNTVALFRHPITTALSVMARDWKHEARDFLYHEPWVEANLDGHQVDLAWQILDSGSPLAQHVLDWTLKMMIPHRAFESGDHPDWLRVTYEQLVLDKEAVVRALSGSLDLPDTEAMLEQSRLPSRTVASPTASHVDDTAFLLDRWRAKVSPSEEAELLEIPRAFGIDMYQPGDTRPQVRFTLGS